MGHPDCHDIKVQPNDANYVLFATDGGVYDQRYNPASTVKTWLSSAQSENATLGLTQFYGIGTHPGDLTQVIGGTQDNGTVTSLGNFNSWRQPTTLNPPPSLDYTDSGWSAYRRSSPATVYATSHGLPYRSTDSGVTFAAIGKPLPNDLYSQIGALALDSGGRLYTAGQYLYRLNAADGWDPMGKSPVVLDPVNYFASVITVAPSDANVIYVGSQDGVVTRVDGALGSSPAFNGISYNLPNQGPTQPVGALSVHPTDTGDLLVGMKRGGQCDDAHCGVGGLWRWSATNSSWTEVDGSGGPAPLPEIGVFGVARDPDAPSTTWYVATLVGVFQTTDAGATWANATAPLGLPNVSCGAIDVNPVTRYMTVGTFGRGMWRVKLPGGTLPDLAVTASSTSHVTGGIKFSATIKNQGTAATPSNVIHNVTFWLDNTIRASTNTSTSSLGVGASRTLTATWSTTTSVTGSHTLRVVVDYAATSLDNRISESNETNNTRTVTVSL